MRHPLQGKTLLVTGGGSGIGRLIATGAAARGARVIVWDLSAESGEATRDQIRAADGAAESFAVDVSDRNAVAQAAAQTGPVDILVNNAGVVTGKSLVESSEEAIERTFRVNTLALYWVTRAFLPGMIARRDGLVTTVTSVAGMVGVARQTDYSGSKFAAFGFAESLRAEMAKDHTGVDSLVVCPYYIGTGMFAGVQTKYPWLLPILKPEYVARRVLDAIEEGRSQLVMPRFARALPMLRALPPAAFDRVMNLLGANDTMDHFTGRPSDAPAPAPAKETQKGRAV